MKVQNSIGLIIVLFTLGFFLKERFSPENDKTNSKRNEKMAINENAIHYSTSKANPTSSVELSDKNYIKLLEASDFEEAINLIIKRSEEHVKGSPTKEDYIKKLDIMTTYIDYDQAILRRNFDFFVSYYTLNAFDNREEKMSQIEYILEESFKKEAQESRYCLDYFKEVGRKKVSYPDLLSVVMKCAGDEKKRDIIFDYVNFLKSTKDESVAVQEYTKLRLMHNELPEYGSF